MQITFHSILPEQQEWTIAHLAEAGYDGFEERESELIAFVPVEQFDPELLNELAFKYQLKYTHQQISEKNWNEIWESNFPPVIIEDFAAVRADFHEPIEGVAHEIVITPKMSFGTGHHATTSMMILQLKDLDLREKKVFDFGTGTGILAILAGKLGAKEVVAVDNDPWSIENARENFQRNNCEVSLQQAENMEGMGSFEVVLANINRNVIESQFASMVEHLAQNGSLILSGILEADIPGIEALASGFALRKMNCNTKGQWVSMRFDRY